MKIFELNKPQYCPTEFAHWQIRVHQQVADFVWALRIWIFVRKRPIPNIYSRG